MWYIKSPVSVFSEILKLNGVKFHGNKITVEKKKPPRTFYSNNIFINSSNLLEILLNIPPPKPVSLNRYKSDEALLKRIKDSFLIKLYLIKRYYELNYYVKGTLDEYKYCAIFHVG